MRFDVKAIGKFASICIISLPIIPSGYADALSGQSQQYLPVPEKKQDTRITALPHPGLPSLNSKLREAMALYYNRQYRLALPLLQEVAASNDSTQVLFWLGRSAYETGQSQLAIEKYQQILAREANLSRVRLELAATYVQAGNKVAARSELQRLIDAKPDAPLKQQIEQALLGLDQPSDTASTKRFFTAIRATIGPEYDSNVNVAAREELIAADDGPIRSKGLDGWLLKFNVNADSIYDFGEPSGFAWHNHLQFLHHEYPDEYPDPTNKDANKDFNYTETNVYTGLDYFATSFKAKLPFGFIDRRFANKALSRSYYFMPNLEIKVLDHTDFALSYRYENEDFFDPYDNLSNRTHTGSLGPRYKFSAFDAEHSLALFGTYSRRDANSPVWSYDEWSVGPSYFAHFKTGTELYVDFKYLGRDYDAPASGFVKQGNRWESRYALTLSLSQTFYKHYFVSLNYNYTDNSSNAAVFDYDKNTVGLNFGTNLNF